MFYHLSRLRWFAIPILAAVAFGLVIANRWWYNRKSPLNLILITLDTTRADRLGAYGYQNGLTASFDRYAEGGVVFERAFAPAPITLPSHTTMLTGLYPPEHGLRVNGIGRLAPAIPFLPEILKTHGYDTAGFVSAAVLDATYGLNRGFDRYDDFSSQVKSSRTRRQRRYGKDVVDQAIPWLGSRTSRPFFCWIHLFDAHRPYDMREETFGERFKQNPYDAGIAEELQQVARVVAMLKDRHLDKNTLVVIAADHGEGLGEHGETDHGMFAYNTTLHVPLVFIGSEHCQPGTRVSTAVSLVDIMPTVLDILRIPLPKHLSGRSLLEALKGREILSQNCYAEAETPYVYNHWSPLNVIISDQWKYIESTRPELYDLLNDFSEQKNLVDSLPEERQDLKNTLEQMMESFISVTPQKLQLTDQQLNDLKALGYVGNPNDVNLKERSKTEVLKDVKDMVPILERFDRAKELATQGKPEEAIVLLREIEELGIQGEFLESEFLLGDCLIATNRLDEAVDVYRTVLDHRPEQVKTGYRLSTVLASLGKFEQAEEGIRKFLKEEPDSAPAHCELAKVLIKTQRIDKGIAEYREAIRLKPNYAPAHLELGQVFVRLKRPKDAASCFEQVIRIEPDNAVAQASLWAVLVQLGEYEKALEYGKRAIEIDPESFEARYNLGVFLISVNRLEEGLRQLRVAQKLRPDDQRPLKLIQQAEAALKQPEKRVSRP